MKPTHHDMGLRGFRGRAVSVHRLNNPGNEIERKYKPLYYCDKNTNHSFCHISHFSLSLNVLQRSLTVGVDHDN